MTNCPNCGAPIDNYRYVKCPHCGTDYYDFAPMEMGKPFYMKFKNDGKVMIARVILTHFNIAQHATVNRMYADGIPISVTCTNPEVDIDISLSAVPDYKGSPENNFYRPALILVDTERMN